ncbi:MAG TPA: hypothetical protein VN364_08140 [Bellilinea sp.]|nr:hypothetical protein [Bellilinea sp.]
MADTFVEVEKNGVRLVVHSTTVEAHKRHGWKVVAEGVPTPKAPGKDKAPEPPKDSSDKPPEETKGK